MYPYLYMSRWFGVLGEDVICPQVRLRYDFWMFLVQLLNRGFYRETNKRSGKALGPTVLCCFTMRNVSPTTVSKQLVDRKEWHSCRALAWASWTKYRTSSFSCVSTGARQGKTNVWVVHGSPANKIETAQETVFTTFKGNGCDLHCFSPHSICSSWNNAQNRSPAQLGPKHSRIVMPGFDDCPEPGLVSQISLSVLSNG